MRNRRKSLQLKTSLKLKQRIKLVKVAAGLCLVAMIAALGYFTLGEQQDSFANGEIVVQPLELTGLCSENPAQQRKWRVRNHNDFAVVVEWDVFPMLQTGQFIAQPGENLFFSTTVAGANNMRIRWQNHNAQWMSAIRPSVNETCSYTPLFATEVVEYLPGKRNDGQELASPYNNPALALGEPEGNPFEGYVALGFGGQITLKFAQPVANGNGNDLRIVESTLPSRPCNGHPESALVFGSQDGCHFVYLGKGCQDFEIDFGPLTHLQYIRLIDVSPVQHTYKGGLEDGFDLDAIVALNGLALNPLPDQLVPGSAQEVIRFSPGRRRNGLPVHHTRLNPQMALGVPDQNDLGMNFVSLGFGGSIVLKFDFAVFDKPGNDLLLVETSFGAPDCPSYPERVFAEGSLDGVEWMPLGEVCLDGELDLNGVPAIQFVRLLERSRASQFSPAADGYDLDGILVINQGCGAAFRKSYFDNNLVPDEIAEISVSPNPFKEQLMLNYETGSALEDVVISIYNTSGQQLYSQKIRVAANTLERIPLPVEQLPKGIYIVGTESGGFKQSIKVVKNG